tara:strand:+ start:226 stop:960 length:735 start_codon:yes stop_codon:yes gene_type:complete
LKVVLKISSVIIIVLAIGFLFLKRDILVKKSELVFNYFVVNTGMVLSEVWVKGRHNQNKNEILNAININIGDSTLLIDLDLIRDKINQLPWIANSSVYLQSRGILEIDVLEYIPVAVYELNNINYLIDINGNKIIQISPYDYIDLIRVLGENALQSMDEIKLIVKTLKNNNLSLNKIERIGNRRWNIYFSEGFYVKLPSKNPQSALSRLENFFFTYDVKSEKLAFIDLRLLDTLTFKLKDQLSE